MSDEFDGRVLNPEGVLIDLPFWVFKRAKRLCILGRALDISRLEREIDVLLDVSDAHYRRKHGLTVTGNHSLSDLVDRERLHPAIVRRLDDMCRMVEV